MNIAYLIRSIRPQSDTRLWLLLTGIVAGKGNSLHIAQLPSSQLEQHRQKLGSFH
jgi:hypothetical protein